MQEVTQIIHIKYIINLVCLHIHVQRSLKGTHIIKCTPRENEGASRFIYAYDRQIEKRMVDVSGILIPNSQLRVIPNRGIPLCYQDRNIPTNQAILSLSQSIGNISATDLNKTFNLSNANLQFKASRPKLSRKKLLGLGTKTNKRFCVWQVKCCSRYGSTSTSCSSTSTTSKFKFKIINSTNTRTNSITIRLSKKSGFCCLKSLYIQFNNFISTHS